MCVLINVYFCAYTFHKYLYYLHAKMIYFCSLVNLIHFLLHL